MGRAIGIDLGTTYSVVAYVDANGQPRVIPNGNGKPTTPSVVYIGEREILVGDAAKEQQAVGARDVASFFKRHVGEPHYVLEFHGKDYTPVDLSTLVLADLKKSAERFFSEPVTDAVITTPAYFTHVQRGATMEAGRRAGLNVRAIISEPTAAALAYGFRPGATNQRVLVYDLGGGTFDISIVEIGDQELRVLATDGDHHLGGRDWDDRLVVYLQQRFQDEFGVDLVGDDFNELLVQAETLKRSLSERESVSARVQAGGQVGTYEISRDQFAQISHDLMVRTEALTESTLRDARLTWGDLAGVLPVGGSTKMPMVREYIQHMSGRPPMGGINPDEAVGLGAAISASMEVGNRPTPRYSLMRIRDVVAHGLGMIAESEDRSRYLNSIIVPRNLEIPATETRPYVFPLRRSGPNQLEVFITQGETDNPQDCSYLGLYAVSGFSETAERKAVVDITYAYDKSSLVQVSAVERSTRRPLTVTIEQLPPDVPARFLQPPSQQQSRRHATVYLAFDLSGSMYGNPLAQAQRAAEAFASNCDLSTTSIGVIEFSDRVNTSMHATQDATKISRAIRGLREGSTGGGNAGQPFTEILSLMEGGLAGRVGDFLGFNGSRDSSALQRQQQRLSGQSGGSASLSADGDDGSARYGIVLTDGVWSSQQHAITEAKRCHSASIEIIAIGFGTADRKFLEAVASSTEQGFFTDLSRLTDVFTTIAQELTESDGERRVGAGLQQR